VLKFWFHLTKDGQKRRLKSLEKNRRRPGVSPRWNWERLKTYDKLQDVVRPRAAHDQHAVGTLDHHRGRG